MVPSRLNMSQYTINGSVSEGYEPVRKHFEKNFSKGTEENAQLCVYVGESKVVDLWGMLNETPKHLWRTEKDVSHYNADTLTPVFSCSKSLIAICIGTLVDKGLLKYTDKISKHWPEYCNDGSKGKEAMTIAQILQHEGGMSKLSKTLTLADVQREQIKKNAVGRIIEKEPLRFPPPESKTNIQYHMLTFGFILNEIFRRVDPGKRTIGECLRQDISLPLDANAHIGLKYEELENPIGMSTLTPFQVVKRSFRPKCLGRKVEPSIIDMLKRLRFVGSLKNQNSGKYVPPLENLRGSGEAKLLLSSYLFSCMKTGELPSVNGQCSARGLARIAAMMANKGILNGTRILSEETWEILHRNRESKLMYPSNGSSNFTEGGVNHFDTVTSATEFFKANEYRKGFFGWMGLGGSVFQWNPVHRIGFSYVPTLLAWEDPANFKGALLQNNVLDCVKAIKSS